jgi:hypothetical protein
LKFYKVVGIIRERGTFTLLGFTELKMRFISYYFFFKVFKLFFKSFKQILGNFFIREILVDFKTSGQYGKVPAFFLFLQPVRSFACLKIYSKDHPFSTLISIATVLAPKRSLSSSILIPALFFLVPPGRSNNRKLMEAQI